LKREKAPVELAGGSKSLDETLGVSRQAARHILEARAGQQPGRHRTLDDLRKQVKLQRQEAEEKAAAERAKALEQWDEAQRLRKKLDQLKAATATRQHVQGAKAPLEAAAQKKIARQQRKAAAVLWAKAEAVWAPRRRQRG